ncbi:MAG: HEAT repeat domain-containing protein [Chloroflexi bacterium]|nr:HEAT repeat domain-containing protein [Chloroflexota bacterium]
MSYWIDELDNPSSVERRRARVVLIELGPEAVSNLVAALNDPHVRVRQEVVKALEAIGGDSAAKGLVKALEDEDVGIRWLAAEALGELGVTGLRPVLEALVHDSGLSWLREGAHHVLHFYKGELNKPLEQLLSALENSTITEAVTWDAGVALQSLNSLHRQPKPEIFHAWR